MISAVRSAHETNVKISGTSAAALRSIFSDIPKWTAFDPIMLANPGKILLKRFLIFSVIGPRDSGTNGIELSAH
jgi:hypothetical protein